MHQHGQGFGKRGRVEIPREPERPQPPADFSWMKYAAGGIAAIFLFGLVMGGTGGGGGGLLGGLIGGLLGHHLGKKLTGPSVAGTPSAPAAAAAQSGTVQRGGFGSTGSSSSHSSFGS